MKDLFEGLLIGFGFFLFSNLFKQRGGTRSPVYFSKFKPKKKSNPKNIPGKKTYNIIQDNISKKSISIQNTEKDPFGSLRTPDAVKEKNQLKLKMKQKMGEKIEEKIGESSDSDDSDYERKKSSEELKELKEYHRRKNEAIPMTNNLTFIKTKVEPIHTHNFIPLLSQ